MNYCNFDGRCKYLEISYALRVKPFKPRVYDRYGYCTYYNIMLDSKYETSIKKDIFKKCPTCMIWKIIL